MSDHIPVCMQVILGGDVAVMEQNELIETAFLNNENELNIFLNKNVKSLEIKILDLSGQLIMNNNYFYSSEIKMQLNEIPSGIYLASVLADGKFSTFKFALIRN
jgi:hypothetical protein